MVEIPEEKGILIYDELKARIRKKMSRQKDKINLRY